MVGTQHTVPTVPMSTEEIHKTADKSRVGLESMTTLIFEKGSLKHSPKREAKRN